MANNAKRQAIGKRLRFRIFARDEFTCRYCGKQPPEVKLVIDHVIPVVEGGTNDEPNLLTACHDCNAGKAAAPLPPHLCHEGNDEVDHYDFLVGWLACAQARAEAEEEDEGLGITEGPGD